VGVTVVGIAGGMAATAFAQPMTTLASDRRWAVDVDLLSMSVGGATSFENGMRASHFNDTIADYASGISTPTSNNLCDGLILRRGCGGELPNVEIARNLNNGWSVSVLLTRTSGLTSGERSAALQILSLDHRVDSVGALVSIGRRAQLGLGPALQIVRVRESAGPSGVEKPWTDHVKLGFVVRGTVAVPERSRIFFTLRAAYQFTGHIDVGPYTPQSINDKTITFPSTSTGFSYWYVGLGLPASASEGPFAKTALNGCIVGPVSEAWSFEEGAWAGTPHLCRGGCFSGPGLQR
jgi:hypothetical protein